MANSGSSGLVARLGQTFRVTSSALSRLFQNRPIRKRRCRPIATPNSSAFVVGESSSHCFHVGNIREGIFGQNRWKFLAQRVRIPMAG
jgi:hypothetical protein